MQKSRSSYSSGFTIVELLIVIVVIGILAAIVIVAYQGVTNRANDAAVKADLSSIAKKLESTMILEGASSYPVSETDLSAVPVRAGKSAYDTTINNFVYCRSDSSSSIFAIVARSKSGNTYYVSNTSLNAREYTGVFPTSRTTLCSVGFGATGSDYGLIGLTSSGWAGWVK